MNSSVHTRHLNHSVSRWELLPVLLVVWLAPFLGGSVEHWSRAVLFLLLGILLLIYPPHHGLTTRSRILLGVMALLPLTAFLPVKLTGLTAWRSLLEKEHGVVFPPTLSAQPWMALDAWWLWLGALIWVWWLAGQGWTRTTRKPLAELFAAGMLVLAIFSITGFYGHHSMAFWHNERNFGPFPNRNQTADLFSLSFIVVTALLHMSVLRKSRLAFLWAGGLLLLGYALILNYSRAGILLPAVGLAAYWLIDILAHPSRKKLWIGLSLVLIGFSMLLAFGGATLDRFHSAEGTGEGVTSHFRLMIFRDTLAMSSQSRFLGVGLAGFEWVFPLFRDLSMAEQRSIHPESDWLWLVAELGWPTALLIFGVAVWSIWRVARLAIRKPHPLRVAGVVCGMLFVLHGFFDVSGHRPGTFFPALFIFALAWSGEISSQHRPSIWLSRGAAVFLCLAGIGWLVNGMDRPFLHGPQEMAFTKKIVSTTIASRHPQAGLPLLEQALIESPLDWELYYQRGVCRILDKRDWPLVLNDFRLALRLEPSTARLPDIEGTSWLSYRPVMASIPWAETLRRLSPEARPGQYERYLVMSQPWPDLHLAMLEIAGSDPALNLVRLRTVEDAGFTSTLQDFLHRHPQIADVRPQDQRVLLEIWADRGDPGQMLDFLAANKTIPDSAKIYPQAHALSRLHRFEEAAGLLLSKMPAPTIPRFSPSKDAADLHRQLYSNNSLLAGLSLYQIQTDAGQSEEMIETLQRLQSIPEVPPYVFYKLGQALAAEGQWADAWTALETYARKSKF